MVRMKRGLKMFKGNITVMMMMVVVVMLVEKCTQKAAFTVRRHASVCRKFRFVAVAMGGCGLLASKVSTFNQTYLNTTLPSTSSLALDIIQKAEVSLSSVDEMIYIFEEEKKYLILILRNFKKKTIEREEKKKE
ncbi:hypothetical protein T01_3090 [Trichinella spiralis]|uniref:Uncharacterized protein n=1 Tax=Trichinella spiralis TaxID=6334 RepID=A0A0V1BN85_TRISP|nr:hypothetical protein T01_3090 [Trichinella spiralis]